MSTQPSATRSSERAPVAVRMVIDAAGRAEYPAAPVLAIAMHVGRSVYMSCSRDGKRHRGLGVHGDIDIIPPWTASVWEPEDVDTVLAVTLDPSLLAAVAEDFDVYPEQIEFRNRFQIRDPQIENIGWAMKAELEASSPGGQVFFDSLGTALAVHVLQKHSNLEATSAPACRRFAGHQLKRMLAYIEDNLEQRLTLAGIASAAGASPSHCKMIFRSAMGMPVYQYVIQRRVERARTLLVKGDLPISDVALRAGFAHQSHLTHHMKRLLGYTPGELMREVGGCGWP